MKFRKARFIALCILFSFFLMLSVIFPRSANAELTITAQNVEYNLPYPGILADHPLYFVKALRDKMQLFLARDSYRKAEITLNDSDKKTHMALLLSKKSKWQMAANVMRQAEDAFDQIPKYLETSRSQGTSPTDEFVLTLRLSNDKHYQIIETLLKDSPQGERAAFEQILQINRKLKGKLLKL